jgi:hypothetical protein
VLLVLSASPDGVTETNMLVEIKVPCSRQIIPGECPQIYYPQLQTCMEVLDLPRAAFIQYKPECLTWPKPMQLDITYVDRDREWWADALPKLEQFRKDLETFEWTPPPPRKPRKVLKIDTPKKCSVLDDLYEKDIEDVEDIESNNPYEETVKSNDPWSGMVIQSSS